MGADEGLGAHPRAGCTTGVAPRQATDGFEPRPAHERNERRRMMKLRKRNLDNYMVVIEVGESRALHILQVVGDGHPSHYGVVVEWLMENIPNRFEGHTVRPVAISFESDRLYEVLPAPPPAPVIPDPEWFIGGAAAL